MSACGHGPEHVRIRRSGVRECGLCRRARLRRAREARRARVRPLVFATRHAGDQATRLGIERPIENVAMDALAAGRLARDPGEDGGVVPLPLDDRLSLLIARTRSASGRKAFLIVGLKTTD